MKSSAVTWTKIAELGETVLLLRNGLNVPQSKNKGGLPITRIETIADSAINTTAVGYTGLETVGEKDGWLLKHGDILFSHINSVPHIGKCAIYEGEPEQILHGTNLVLMRPVPQLLDSKFLLYYFRSNRFRADLLRFVNPSVNQASVSVTNLKKIKIPLPPLSEQKRIAAILDKADEIRRKRQESLRLADQFLRSVFLDMFGDPVTNPKGWETCPLSDFGEITTGNTPSRKVPSNYGKYIEWIKSDNINGSNDYLTPAVEGLSRQGLKSARTAPPGSILVTCIAGSPSCIGNCAIADREIAFNQQINAVTPFEGFDTAFIYTHFLVGKKLVQNASTKGMKGLVSKSKFSAIRLLRPPTKMRNQFQQFFERLIRMKKALHTASAKSDELVLSLSQRMFAGKL